MKSGTSVDWIAGIGRHTRGVLSYLGGLSLLLADGLWWMFIGPLKGKGGIRTGDTLKQAYRMSVGSFGIVSLVVFFVGMIIALQSAYVLQMFDIVPYVGNMMGISMVREMGPLIVGVVMTGFSGAAIAAEIGTMVVSEEVLALETGALHPVRFLVVPRLLGAMLMMPIIAVYASLLGIVGGFVVSWLVLDLDPEQYFQRAFDSLVARDVIAGLLKAEAFGLLITLIACYEGLRVTGGAEGVGRATTNSVVRGIVALIVCDLIFTAVFFFV